MLSIAETKMGQRGLATLTEVALLTDLQEAAIMDDQENLDIYDSNFNIDNLMVVDGSIGYFIDMPKEGFQEFRKLNKTAFTQLSSKLGFTKEWYSGTCFNSWDPDTLLYVLKNEYKSKTLDGVTTDEGTDPRDIQKDMLLRVKGDTIRAVLSQRYLCLNNSHVLGILNQSSNILKDFIVVQYNMNHDRFYVKLVYPHPIPGSGDDPVYLGIIIENSETGFGAFSATLFMYNVLCTNGMISKTNMFNLRKCHSTGINNDVTTVSNRILGEFQKTCDGAVETGYNVGKAYLSWKECDTTIGRYFNKLENNTLFTRKAIGQFEKKYCARVDREDQPISVYKAVNNVTRFSQEFKDDSVRIPMEGYAFKLGEQLSGQKIDSIDFSKFNDAKII